MELLVVTLIATIIGGFLIRETYLWLTPISRWLATTASRLVPRGERERYREQWISDLEQLPPSIARLWFAAMLILAAARLRRSSTLSRFRRRRDAYMLKWSLSLTILLIPLLDAVDDFRMDRIVRRLTKLEQENISPQSFAAIRSLVARARGIGECRLQVGLLQACEGRSARFQNNYATTAKSRQVFEKAHELLRGSRKFYEERSRELNAGMDAALAKDVYTVVPPRKSS